MTEAPGAPRWALFARWHALIDRGDDRFSLVATVREMAQPLERNSGVVAPAVDLYERWWAAAAPAVPEGECPPFTRRMVDIARRLVDGATDREIARSLGVSERTVSADVGEMSRRLGARSRAQAIALVLGASG